VDPEGRTFGQKDRYTLLHVQLDPGGALRRVFVETGSGIDRLDLQAITALERAAPFPPAPAQLLRNGLVDFRFRFHFKPPAPSSHRPAHPPPSRFSP
jgi:TonB family protein